VAFEHDNSLDKKHNNKKNQTRFQIRDAKTDRGGEKKKQKKKQEEEK